MCIMLFVAVVVKKKTLGGLCLVLIKNNSVFLAHTFFHSFFTSCQISSPTEPEQQQRNYGKQVLSCQSQTRLEQDWPKQARAHPLPTTHIHTIYITPHYICSATLLTVRPDYRRGKEKGGGPSPTPHHSLSSYHRAMLLACPV